ARRLPGRDAAEPVPRSLRLSAVDGAHAATTYVARRRVGWRCLADSHLRRHRDRGRIVRLRPRPLAERVRAGARRCGIPTVLAHGSQRAIRWDTPRRRWGLRRVRGAPERPRRGCEPRTRLAEAAR